MTENSSQGTNTCLNCGVQFPAVGARFCPVCGQTLSATQAPLLATPAAPAAPTPAPTVPTSAPMTSSPMAPIAGPTPPAPAPAPAYGQPQAYGQPPTHQQPQGYGPVPGHPAPYGYAPTRARRNSMPILVGLGVIGLVLVVIAGAFAVSGGFGSGASSSAASPLVTAGGASEAPTTAAATAALTGKFAYKDMVVGFIQTGTEGGWRAANTSSFTETAAADGITLKVAFSNNNFTDQIAAFNQFIADPTVNVIVLAPVINSGYVDVLNAAKAAGKVVVLEDHGIDADSSLYFTSISPDFETEGQKAAAAMCDLLKGMKGTNVVEIAGDQGNPAASGRAKGFREKMGGCGITVTASQSAAYWDPGIAKSIMEADLKASKNIQGVFAHNDQMAIAAIQAIDAAGLKAGKDIKVVGLDATADGFQYLISGELGADIECSPLQAPQVYEAALKALNGDTTVPKWIPTQEGAFFASQGADALRAILATRKY